MSHITITQKIYVPIKKTQRRRILKASQILRPGDHLILKHGKTTYTIARNDNENNESFAKRIINQFKSPQAPV